MIACLSSKQNHTMFNANINSLRNNTMTKAEFSRILIQNENYNFLPNTLVNNNSNSMSSYVKDSASFTMVESMRQTFLYSTITLIETD